MYLTTAKQIVSNLGRKRVLYYTGYRRISHMTYQSKSVGKMRDFGTLNHCISQNSSKMCIYFSNDLKYVSICGLNKGPVKLIKRVKIAHSFLQASVRSVPRYHFKLAYVTLQTAVKEFFKTHSKNGEIGHFNLSLLKESF